MTGPQKIVGGLDVDPVIKMPGPRDVPDPTSIINEPRRRRAAAHLNDANNTSKDPTLQRLRAGTSLSATSTPQESTPRSLSPSSSPVVDIEEDEDAIPKTNLPPRNSANVIEASDDEEDQRDGERSHRTQRKAINKRKRVVLGSDDEDVIVVEEAGPSASKSTQPPKKRPQLQAENADQPEAPEEDAESMLGE